MDRISPELIVDMGSRKVTLCGTLAVLKRLQISFDCDITQLQDKIIDARFDRLAEMFKISCVDEDIAQGDFEAWIIDQCGIDEAKYIMIEFWVISVSPEKKREENRVAVLERVTKLRQATAFLGENIASFA